MISYGENMHWHHDHCVWREEAFLSDRKVWKCSSQSSLYGAFIKRSLSIWVENKGWETSSVSVSDQSTPLTILHKWLAVTLGLGVSLQSLAQSQINPTPPQCTFGDPSNLLRSGFPLPLPGQRGGVGGCLLWWRGWRRRSCWCAAGSGSRPSGRLTAAQTGDGGGGECPQLESPHCSNAPSPGQRHPSGRTAPDPWRSSRSRVGRS